MTAGSGVGNISLRSIRLMLVLSCVLSLSLLMAGCAENSGGDTWEEHRTGSMDLQYATQFSVDHYEDDVSVISIEDGLRYLLVPDRDDLPDWLSDADLSSYTIIESEPESVYMAASSAMDLLLAADCLDNVSMTSTQASDWGIPEIRAKVENGDILYIGKYRAPDYEALLELEADLAVESTMIYHNPQIKEAIEDLGIPVLVERSSYETDPVGRLEWIRLYGLIMGKEDAAAAFFNEALDKISSVDPVDLDKSPKVAYFSVNSAGSIVVRKPGDYVTRMIEMAGGHYALDGAARSDDNALSTMNMQMEAFYEQCIDADILIYNSTIESELTSISQLTEKSDKFSDFRAVRSGNVWCTNRNVFQKTTASADMIVEMNKIFVDPDVETELEYFHKLK